MQEKTANNLIKDLKAINLRAFQLEMSFNCDTRKQAQEVIFSRKSTEKTHPETFFNNIPRSKADSQKYLGLHLDLKLSFDIHIKTVLIRALHKYKTFFIENKC